MAAGRGKLRWYFEANEHVSEDVTDVKMRILFLTCQPSGPSEWRGLERLRPDPLGPLQREELG